MMMYVCLGKSGCRSDRRRSPEYGDIAAVSPTKIKQSAKKMDKYRTTNGYISSAGTQRASLDAQEGCNRRISAQSLDVNDNSQRWTQLSKSSTLPRRFHHGKTPPPKPPRVPPKPPRLMEKQLFVCENPACRKEETLLGIVELDFKSCPCCFTHYCSLECRRGHWNDHRRVCHYGRVNCHMRAIGDVCAKNQVFVGYLSEIAREGYTNKGRGAVLLILPSPKAAELFLDSELEYFRNRHGTPTYSSLQEIKDTGVTSKHQKQLLELVSEYCPTRELVVNVAIVVGKNLPQIPVPRNKAPAVIEQFKIPFKAGFYTRFISPQNSQDMDTCSSHSKQNSTRRKSF